MTLWLMDVTQLSRRKERRKRKKKKRGGGGGEAGYTTFMDAPCTVSQGQQEEHCSPEESPVGVLEKTDDAETLLR